MIVIKPRQKNPSYELNTLYYFMKTLLRFILQSFNRIDIDSFCMLQRVFCTFILTDGYIVDYDGYIGR